MTVNKKRIAIIGGGPMGLGVAYYLGKQGIPVTIYEAGDRVGGMTASFDFDGVEIERFFHFLCATDYDYFEILKELGIEDKLHWVNTRMGYFYNGKLSTWGDPISLLKFPGLSLIDKFRYGLKVLYCKQLKSFEELDKKTATQWLRSWLGERAYQVLWHPLMSLKFYEWQDLPSAAWIAARVQRVAQSRESLFKEKTGYLTGCSEILMKAMVQAIEKQGGIIHLGQPIKQVIAEKHPVQGQCIKGIKVGDSLHEHSIVISTTPIPYVSKMIPDLPKEDHEKLARIKNVGVVCLMFKLDRQFSPYFWLNINTPGVEMPGIIEYTNLNPLNGRDHILYVPYYMPQTQTKYSWSNEQFFEEVTAAFKKIRPDFDRSWVKSFHASRYFYAQPVCEPGYLSMLPPMKSAIKGLFMADTSYYYPQDRSITESLKTAKQLAALSVKEWELS
jgi:protoporphyrinogen oxidase